ncbi:nuclear transport factor 2 family protein [Ostreiculturibacter nitratireducens]|uniref:nuclear transport factor 2 family protein n=1 Tax=Ostreiculturibacter nitratireducens TaxID=3075226 RepID=UPI0031B5879F
MTDSLVGRYQHMQSDQLLAELLACERKVWDALVSGDAEVDRAALDDRFLGVYPDGFAGKEGHVRQLGQGPTVRSYDLSELRVMRLGEEYALLAYRATFIRSECEEPEEMFVSSIWQRRPGGWINVFSQDTPATGISVP